MAVRRPNRTALRGLAVAGLAAACLGGTLAHAPESAARALPDRPAPELTRPATPAVVDPTRRPRRRAPSFRAEMTPTYEVETVVSDRAQLWDLAFAPDGSMVYDQRGGPGSSAGLFVRHPDGTGRQLAADLGDLFVGSETGLMGLAVDPSFAVNRRIYSCQGYRAGGTTDIRVQSWQVDAGWTRATRLGAPLVTGIPVTSGRHGGCRLRFDATRALLVGTGDAAIGTAPRDLGSLGGKVLRINPATGTGVIENPYLSSPNPRTKLIWTSGHRNVQGLAVRPGTDEVWSAEHGPDRDDEVNKLVPGADYGWDPAGAGGSYDESVPMTRAGATPARWSSGPTTVATSGATWIDGPRWGRWQGALAVATLKDQKLLVLTPGASGTIVRTEAVLTGQYGRLRTVQLGPDGSLYVATANGSGDRILRITPTRTGRPAARPMARVAADRQG